VSILVEQVAASSSIETELLRNGVLGLMLLIALVGLVYLFRRVEGITALFIAFVKEVRETDAERVRDVVQATTQVAEALRAVEAGFREGFRSMKEQSDEHHRVLVDEIRRNLERGRE
jgi:hypothetical protein